MRRLAGITLIAVLPILVASTALAQTRTPWQMHDGLEVTPSNPYGFVHFTCSPAIHGDSCEYDVATIPPGNDPGWGRAPDGEIINFSIPSRVCSAPVTCWTYGDFTYFQTLVDIPANVAVTTFTIDFSGMDDGCRVTIFNSTYPAGLVVPGSYVFLGGTGTTNLRDYVVSGEVNRVVITQVDDCCRENNLRSAIVVLNGTPIVTNHPPVCNTGGPYSTECQSPTTHITLNGTGSYDPDSTAITYLWTSDCPGAAFDDSSSATPVLTVTSPRGGNIDCIVTLTVNDGQASSSCQDSVHIECPNRPPDCSHAVALEPVLWPPNHSYHAISILGVTDPDGDPVTITVTSVTQDEPVNGRGDGNTCPDAQIVDGQAAVRAERTGTPGVPGNGRVYTMTFTADDGRGGTCSGTVNVCVPHDLGDPTCVDDGQKFTSTADCRGGDELAPEAVSLTVARVTGSQAEISFGLPADMQVNVSVYDVIGRRVATIENGTLASGTYSRVWNMDGVAKGLYFVRLHAGAVTLARRVLKLR